MMNRNLWYNASGYLDTTAGAALSHIWREERKHHNSRVHRKRPENKPTHFELSLYDSDGNCLSVERFPTVREAERECASMEKNLGLNGKVIPI